MIQLFLVMDTAEIPQHIQQTFWLHRDASGTWKTDMGWVEVAVEGDLVDMRADSYVIVYADDTWHAASAAILRQQLCGLRKDPKIVSLPANVNLTDPWGS